MAIASSWGESLRAWWQGATPATRAMATGLVLLLVVGLAVAASLAASPDYHAIYHGVSGKDASAIEAVLREKSIAMKFDDKDGTVSVPSKDESNAFMYIEAAGILSKDTVVAGLGDIDKISIGTTPEVERQRMLNEAQGELAQKLMRLDPVQTAAVSLALPSEPFFVGNETPPSASVILTLKSGETLSGLQIKGIVNLIAHAVPNLTTQNVALTDQNGVPLNPGAGGAGTDGTLMAENDKFSEDKRKVVQNLLDQTVGRGKAVVTVNAELSQDLVTKHSVLHTPAAGLRTGMPISVRDKTETYSGAGGPGAVGGVAGAGGNLNVPSYQTGGGAGGGGKYSTEDNVTNYEPDVTDTQTQVAPGDLKKLSVAALVDTSVPAETVATLKESIAFAVGALPGDNTRVVSVRQVAFDMSSQKAQASQVQALASQALMITIARTLAVCAVAIVLLILLTRSSGRHAAGPQLALAGGGANIGLLDPTPDAEMAAILDAAGSIRGTERGMEHVLEERPLTVEDVLAEMPDPEGRPRRRARAPSIEEQQDLKMESIRTMINAHPESVSLLLKGWMADDVKVA